MSKIINELILEQLPGCVAWKNLDLKYIGANKNLLQAMNLQSKTELLGLDDFELALNSPEMNTLFHEQDLLALKGHSVEIIHYLDNSPDEKAYFLQKTPLRNDEGRITGVIYSCTAWSQQNLLMSLKQIDQKYQPSSEQPDYYSFGAHHNPANLSERELECLFLQLRSCSAKEIAAILGLSKRTVESYIDNLKSKLGCLNKTELLVTAITQGYQRYIPKRLLDLNLPELLKT